MTGRTLPTQKDSTVWLDKWASEGWTRVVEMHVVSSDGVAANYVFLLEKEGEES